VRNFYVTIKQTPQPVNEQRHAVSTRVTKRKKMSKHFPVSLLAFLFN